jgi:hypothetical protein
LRFRPTLSYRGKVLDDHTLFEMRTAAPNDGRFSKGPPPSASVPSVGAPEATGQFVKLSLPTLANIDHIDLSPFDNAAVRMSGLKVLPDRWVRTYLSAVVMQVGAWLAVERRGEFVPIAAARLGCLRRLIILVQ